MSDGLDWVGAGVGAGVGEGAGRELGGEGLGWGGNRLRREKGREGVK